MKLALEAWAHPVGFLSGSPLFARLSDCPAHCQGGGLSQTSRRWREKVKQKLEIARRHKVAPQVSQVTGVSFPVTWPFLLAIPVSFLCLAGPCLAGGGPAWRPACCARGLNGRGLAGGWLAGDLPAAARLGPGRRTQHTAHTHKTHKEYDYDEEFRHLGYSASIIGSSAAAETELAKIAKRATTVFMCKPGLRDCGANIVASVIVPKVVYPLAFAKARRKAD